MSAARVRVAMTLVTGLVGCLDPTQATLEIATNIECGAEAPSPEALFETGIVAGPPGRLPARLSATTHACTPAQSDRNDIGTLVLFPEDGAMRAGAVVVASIGGTPVDECLAAAIGPMNTSAPSCVVARRSIAFIDHRDLRIPVFLDRACAGVLCDHDSTCAVVNGVPTCVSSSCSDPPCDAVPATTSGTGGEGTGGAGGAGGAGGGPPGPVFEVLPLPSGLEETHARSVSANGEVVVGLGTSPAGVHGIAWRSGGAYVLPARSLLADTCQGGDVAVGTSWPAGAPRASAWAWNVMSNDYVLAWVRSGPLESEARRCAETGTLVFGSEAGSGVTYSLAQDATLDVASGAFWGSSASGEIAAGGTGAGAAYWTIAGSGAIGPQALLEPANSMVWAVNAAGTLLAGVAGEALALWKPGSPAPLFVGVDSFQPSAVAGDAANHIVVGNCDPYVSPRACVMVDGAGPFDLDGLSGSAWTATDGVDFHGLALTEAADLSDDGHVIVGTARDPSTMRAVAFRLWVP